MLIPAAQIRELRDRLDAVDTELRAIRAMDLGDLPETAESPATVQRLADRWRSASSCALRLADAAGSICASIHAGRLALARELDALSVPEATPAEPRRNPSPVPRHVAQIGVLRELRLADGSTITRPLRESWPILARAGAERASAGRLVLWIPDPSRARAGTELPSAAAERTYAVWAGIEADRSYTIDVPESYPHTIGRVAAIVYRSDKFDRTVRDYLHEFAEPHPILRAAGDANAIAGYRLSGGRMRLTGRGLVD